MYLYISYNIDKSLKEAKTCKLFEEALSIISVDRVKPPKFSEEDIKSSRVVSKSNQDGSGSYLLYFGDEESLDIDTTYATHIMELIIPANRELRLNEILK